MPAGDYWAGTTSTIADLKFNAGVSGDIAQKLFKDVTSINQITVEGEEVLNVIESLCTQKDGHMTTYYGSSNAGGDGNFRVRILKTLESTTPNAYLNNPENGFTKTEDGLYNVYTSKGYFCASWDGNKHYN